MSQPCARVMRMVESGRRCCPPQFVRSSTVWGLMGSDQHQRQGPATEGRRALVIRKGLVIAKIRQRLRCVARSPAEPGTNERANCPASRSPSGRLVG